MGRAIDETAIQFRMLNTRKGPAVQAPRAQADKQRYRLYMKSVVEDQENLLVRQDVVKRLLVRNHVVFGVETKLGLRYGADAVILTTGTFLKGLIHVGLTSFPGGRAGEPPSVDLAENLLNHGFQIGRLKTGTPPRLHGKSIDFHRLTPQDGDKIPRPFSFSTGEIHRKQVPCYITFTNAETHEIIRKNLDRSPLYSGRIQGIGPRYCPSIEDKVVRFPDRKRHQIFLEPEGLNTEEIYANGISTSLPLDVQKGMVRSIFGMENAEIMRPGYAVEYDFVLPTQLFPSLETKRIQGLFHAGQINGTSGYEEAAAQGLIAGINAARKIHEKDPLILDRSVAYIGVLVDDLVTRGTSEPYRMFTSRAEYRLLLRQDNADLRLRETGYRLGLVSPEDYEVFQIRKEEIEREMNRLKKTYILPSEENNRILSSLKSSPIKNKISLFHLIKRPELDYKMLSLFKKENRSVSFEAGRICEIEAKYEGFIRRQIDEALRFHEMELVQIPEKIDYGRICGLSTEVVEKLDQVRPQTLGQAARISGITPAALSILLVYLKNMGSVVEL